MGINKMLYHLYSLRDFDIEASYNPSLIKNGSRRADESIPLI
ncbi:hypothetical protein RintRC_6611 [Richelia intracellularis]|nr:hypothetical protein RintRC_6611 [Richelia intracellularis]